MDLHSRLSGGTSAFEFKHELMMEEELELDVSIVKGASSHEDNPSTTTQTSKDSSTSKNKVCKVCERPAKYKHFGALCCDSCQSFFRRSVQSKWYQMFFCPEGGNCNISSSKRKCKSCRFARCISIGMDISLVMSVEAREKLLSQRTERLALERKNYITTSPEVSIQEEHPLPRNRSLSRVERPDHDRLDQGQMDASRTYSSEDTLSTEDKMNITSLNGTLRKELSSSDFLPDMVGNGISERLLFLFCKHMGVFFKSVPEFLELNSEDQATLLKPAIAKAIFIYGAHQFEKSRGCWPKKPLAHTFPVITISDIENFIDNHDLIFNWNIFTEKFGDFYSDEIVTILALMIALFDQNETCFLPNPTIENSKAKFTGVLKRYLKWKGPTMNISDSLSYLTESLVEVENLKKCFQNSTTKDKKLKRNVDPEVITL